MQLWNIGAEGQYLAGAIAGNVVGAFVSAPALVTIPILLVAAIGAGALVAMIAAILDWWRKVPVVLLKRGRSILAIGGTCTHWGGPLAEGKLVDGDCGRRRGLEVCC